MINEYVFAYLSRLTRDLCIPPIKINKKKMNSPKEIAIKFVTLVLLCVFVWGEEGVRCIEREREALISFKNGLTDESGILSSWRSEECCNWYGVVCSNTTDGHVIHLELGTLDFAGVLGGKVSSSLLELHHLNYLDLSYNDFGGDQIPEFIGSMKQLRYLDLRACNFFGMVPPELGNLTNLRTLALSSNSLTSDNLNWLSRLSLLSILALGGNDFGGHPIPEFIGSMKKLEQLYLWGCNFSGVIPPQLGNLTNLLTLDLSDNSLNSENLDWLSNLSSLSVLDLSDSLDLSDTNWLHQIPNLHSLQELHLRSCKISYVNPSIVNSSSPSLSFLDLSDNYLTSSVFDWLFNVSLNVFHIDLSENALGGLIPNKFERLSHLEYLDLSRNMFEGEVPKYFGNLSHLQALVMYDNYLRGGLDELIGNLSAKGFLQSSLQILDLADNEFDGPIPDLNVFSALTQVYLGQNNLTGTLPLSFGNLSNLRTLEVSESHLEGVVSESHFTKLDKLRILDLSFNSLSLDVAQDWNPPFLLTDLLLAGCNMGPSFPKWIQNQKNLTFLDLSSVGIIDEVPMWLWSLSPSLQFLSLSDNQISGTIPDLSSILIQEIDLSSNNISSSIPLFHPNTVSFQLSQNMFSGSISSSICKLPHDELIFLDLSNNQLSGELPNCFKKMPNLSYLNLAKNRFLGKMPHSLPDQLVTLSLSHNNLSGELPSTLRFCQELILIDVEGNKLNGEIPSWIGAIYEMRFLNLRSNEFYGGIPPEMCSLTGIRVLDISRNNLSGRIPNCFNNLATLAEKDAAHADYKFGFFLAHSYDPQVSNRKHIKFYDGYSSFQWKGQESEYKKNLVLLTLIDISSNRLSGTIPHSFSNLRGLISLNLSRNNLTGNIIPNIGQMEMLECLDLSHNQLSGQIPMSLAQLDFLDVLDLSDNNLSGKIPSSTQLQSFNASSYDGNDGLCGRPLELCPEDSPRPPTPTYTQGEEDDGLIWSLSFMQGLCISIGFGFIVGFWGAVGSLVLKKSWRYAYFKLLDDVGDWFYVKISIFLSKWRPS